MSNIVHSKGSIFLAPRLTAHRANTLYKLRYDQVVGIFTNNEGTNFYFEMPGGATYSCNKEDHKIFKEKMLCQGSCSAETLI